MRAALVILLSGVLAASPAAGAQRSKIAVSHGYVSLETPDAWAVVSAKRNRAVSSAMFQIPNPSDQGTPDSTTIGLTIYDLATERGRASAAKSAKNAAGKVRLKRPEGAWTLYRQHFADDGDPVPYTTLSGKREAAGIAVVVDLSWPKLPDNPADYDAQMEKLFRAFIATVELHRDADTP